MQVLTDSPLLARANLQDRLFQPLPLGHIDARYNNFLGSPFSPPRTVQDEAINRGNPSRVPQRPS